MHGECNPDKREYTRKGNKSENRNEVNSRIDMIMINQKFKHIATATDPRAHNIFIVDRKDRTKISLSTTQGVDWGQNVWRKIRIERDSKAGTIKVYYDDMTTPIMTASDTTFKAGWVGFGSFDDTGRIDDVKLWAPGKVKARRPTWFPSKTN